MKKLWKKIKKRLLRKWKKFASRFVIYKDWNKNQVSIHFLPSIDFWMSKSYTQKGKKRYKGADITFSWIIWTLEVTLWDRK